MGTRFNKKEYMRDYRRRKRKKLNEEERLWANLHTEKIKDYKHKYHLKHKDYIQEYSKAWQKTHGVYIKGLRLKWRLETVRVLGGKCARCGFDDIRALQIDHIAGGGAQEIKCGISISYLKKVIESIAKQEGKYQLLCANCNWIKRHENHECGITHLAEVW